MHRGPLIFLLVWLSFPVLGAGRTLIFSGAFFSQYFDLSGTPNNSNVGMRAFYDIDLVNVSGVPQTGTIELLPSSRFGIDGTTGLTNRSARISVCGSGLNQTRASDQPNSSDPILLPSQPSAWGVAARGHTTIRIVARLSALADLPIRKFSTTFSPTVKLTVNEDKGALIAIPFSYFGGPNGLNCDGSTDANVVPIQPPVATSFSTHPINAGRAF